MNYFSWHVIYNYIHYGRSKICRVPHALPSVVLGKELHSAKSSFAECRSVPGARQSTPLGKCTLCRAQHSAKSALGKMPVSCPPTPSMPLPSLKKMFTERLTWHSAKRPFAECWQRGPLPSAAAWHSAKALFAECQAWHSAKYFCFFWILISIFL